MRFAGTPTTVIFMSKSKRAGQRVLASITRFLASRLKLKVNPEKSAVARPWDRKFLGYSMTFHTAAKA